MYILATQHVAYGDGKKFVKETKKMSSKPGSLGLNLFFLSLLNPFSLSCHQLKREKKNYSKPKEEKVLKFSFRISLLETCLYPF